MAEQPAAHDLRRDLLADLALCEQATPGPWIWWDMKDSGSGGSHDTPLSVWSTPDDTLSDGRLWGLGPDGAEFDEDRCVLSGDNFGQLNCADADFIATARTGWPAAIRRALAAEAEVARLRKQLNHTFYPCHRCETVWPLGRLTWVDERSYLCDECMILEGEEA